VCACVYLSSLVPHATYLTTYVFVHAPSSFPCRLTSCISLSLSMHLIPDLMFFIAVLLPAQGRYLILADFPCRLAYCFCVPISLNIFWLTYCPSVYLPVTVPSFRLAYRLCIPPDFGCFPFQAGSLPMCAHLLLDELLICVFVPAPCCFLLRLDLPSI